MKRRIVGLLMLMLVAGHFGVRSSAQASDTKAAQAAAEAWLSLIDKPSYVESWKSAAAIFRDAITAEKWEAAVRSARSPLGALKARALKSATATRTLPGAPDGEYVVFDYSSSYEHKAAAAERVTAMLEKDGAWRVAGYFVK